MADDAYDRWLTGFRKEVDDSLSRTAPQSLGAPEARQAQEAFDQWWQTEQQPVTEAPARFEVGTLDEPLRPTRRPEPERYLAEEWPVRLEKLADERARLLLRSEKAEEEARGLRERLSTIQTELASYETRLSRSRQAFEDHIARLEDQARGMQEQLKDLRESKASLDAALQRAQSDQSAAHEQASLEKTRADMAESSLGEARRKIAELETRLAEISKQNAAREGSLDELRRQSSVYSHRLVQSKEATDNDVMSMRQELKTFLEELRLLRNSLRKGE